jgi:GntR family transcriptional repressor for pyruvate dehydrogenase complex
MEFKPVETKRVYKAVMEQIIEMIRDDKLRVGEKLPPERELAVEFGVSRASIREALRVMETMGLLERKPGGGSIVTDLNIGSFLNMLSPIFFKRGGFAIELVELRYLLETKAARLAAENITEEGARELRGVVERMRRANTDGDRETESASDIELHETLFRLTGNTALVSAAKFVTDLLEHSVRFGRRVILEGGLEPGRLLEQHEEIVNAVAAGEPARAAQAMREHMELVIEFYLQRYPESEDSSGEEAAGNARPRTEPGPDELPGRAEARGNGDR